MSQLQRMIERLAEKQVAINLEPTYDYFKGLIEEGVKLGISSNDGDSKEFTQRFHDKWLRKDLTIGEFKQKLLEQLNPIAVLPGEMKLMTITNKGHYMVKSECGIVVYIDIEIMPEDTAKSIYNKIDVIWNKATGGKAIYIIIKL